MTDAGPAVVIHGRTYWDAEIEVAIESLGTGKGKRDLPVRVVLGGWAANAAGALAGRFPAGDVAVVTVSAALDLPRLCAQLPAGVRLEILDSGEDATAMPPVAVIVNPASDCRLLRDPMAGRDACWTPGSVEPATLAAPLHLLGRLPPDYARGVVDAAHANGGRTGWVGGDALPIELERDLDGMGVNSDEAGRLLQTDGAAPADNAVALLARAAAPGAVRVVTGRSAAPAVAAVRETDGVRCHEAPSTLIPRERITRLKGAGDTFAATFLAATWFDQEGVFQARPRVEAALADAQQAAEAFITQVWP